MVVGCVSQRDEGTISMLSCSQHRRRSIGAGEDGGNVGIGKGGSHSLDGHEAKRRVRFRTGSAPLLRLRVRRQLPDLIECPIYGPQALFATATVAWVVPAHDCSDPVVPGALPN